MNDKQIYFFDDCGVFSGVGFAQYEPVSEQHLFPPDCTEIAPPKHDAVSQCVRWCCVKKRWSVEDLPVQEEAKPDKQRMIEMQCAMIDKYIAYTIKNAVVASTGEVADYDSFGEMAMYAIGDNDTYAVEARTLTRLAMSCHAIQADIKNGVLVYDNVADCIAALPKV